MIGVIDYTQAIQAMLTELLDGPEGGPGFVLNPGDQGLLRSLERLSVDEAQPLIGHVDHLRYEFDRLNTWQAGQDPFANANYGASWRRSVTSESEWRALLHELKTGAYGWREAMAHPLGTDETWRKGIVASVVHVAYHMGAMRQICAAIRGPKAAD